MIDQRGAQFINHYPVLGAFLSTRNSLHRDETETQGGCTYRESNPITHSYSRALVFIYAAAGNERKLQHRCGVTRK